MCCRWIDLRHSGRVDSSGDFRGSTYDGERYRNSRYSFKRISDYDDYDADLGIPLFFGSFHVKDVLIWIQVVEEFFNRVYVPLEKQAKLVAISLRVMLPHGGISFEGIGYAKESL